MFPYLENKDDSSTYHTGLTGEFNGHALTNCELKESLLQKFF